MYIAAILLLSTLAAAVPVEIVKDGEHTLPEAPIKWMGELERGGPTVNITGYHKDVVRDLHAKNPWWHREGTYVNATSESIMDGSLPHFPVHFSRNGSSLEARSNRVNQVCNGGNPLFGRALLWRQKQNVAYLAPHYGNGMCGVAPYACGRFSCSYDSSILFCNNNPTEAVIPCPTLAQNHNFLLGWCDPAMGGKPSGYEKLEYAAQAFYINPRYNIIQKHVDIGKHC